MKKVNLQRRHWLMSTAQLGVTLGAGLALPQIAFAAKAEVIIIGGGFGGATAARYIKRKSPTINVTLIEPNQTYYTCPFSNLYLGGLRNYQQQVHSYDGLRAIGINVVHDTAQAIDAEKRLVHLKQHTDALRYDKLLLAPGIDMQWGRLAGYDAQAALLAPHAWQGGEQAKRLRKQLLTMPDGGTFIMVIPENPFRCPPGPYERASLIAHYFSKYKPRSKILLLDAKDGFSKQALFMDAWQKLYGALIEWVPFSKDGKAIFIDAKNKRVETEFGQKHSADVLNVIPPQKAAAITLQAGLTDPSGWVPINHNTFNSLHDNHIYVVGDATIASPMPKSGFSANTQAKVAAAAIVNALQGKPAEPASLANTCYSLIAPNYGISVAHLYGIDKQKIIERSGGVSPLNADSHFRQLEAQYGSDWYDAITTDIWGALS